MLPFGRLELDFGAGVELTGGELNLDEGVATVWISTSCSYSFAGS